MNRTLDQLKRHYEVERELAARLRSSTQEERAALFKELYTELFERVPDHPRLTRRESPEESQRKVEGQMRLLRPFLKSGATLVEFAPGDCRLAIRACETAGNVIGVDISDQRSDADMATAPAHFELAVYDGYSLDLPDQCADVIFSYQFLEHLHPDDFGPHLDLAHRLLKPGGVYVFDTPHRYSGPHDVSRHFSETLDCFHFQEWTHREMRARLKEHGFERSEFVRLGRPWPAWGWNFAVDSLEWLLLAVPSKRRQKLCARILPSVAMAAWKF